MLAARRFAEADGTQSWLGPKTEAVYTNRLTTPPPHRLIPTCHSPQSPNR